MMIKNNNNKITKKNKTFFFLWWGKYVYLYIAITANVPASEENLKVMENMLKLNVVS